MAIKVLVVDDSVFYRNRITELLKTDNRIEVVGYATDGLEATKMVQRLKPHVVTMDVEMPNMDGIAALKVIMRETPTHVVMLSAHTSEGAVSTIRALEAGAADYFLKNTETWTDPRFQLKTKLVERIVALCADSSETSARHDHLPFQAVSSHLPTNRPPIHELAHTEWQKPFMSASRSSQGSGTETHDFQAKLHSTEEYNSGNYLPSTYDIVVIGASTGGPAALQLVLSQLPAHFPLPILIVQHMPAAFTKVFAERLNHQCDVKVKEAEDGDILQPGCAYLAPGGMQMILDKTNKRKIRVLVGEDRLTYKPSVDVTFASVARAFANKVLAIVLTGMGADGTEGARHLASKKATIWAQDEATSTIWGMPKSVIQAGLANKELSLEQVGSDLSRCRRAS